MERRRTERRAPDCAEPLSQVRLRGGRDLSVVDISDDGALIEGARLLPGTHVDVHVTTREGRVLVRSRVIRAYVAGLQAHAVRYQAALAFERAVDTSSGKGYAVPLSAPASSLLPGSDYPPNVTAIDGRSHIG